MQKLARKPAFSGAARADLALADAAPQAVRIVVAHHPMVHQPDYERNRPMWGSAATLAHLSRLNVELVLSGHRHRSLIASSEGVYEGANEANRVLVVQAGTATSSRGRTSERQRNSFNLVEIDSDEIRVTQYRHAPERNEFYNYAEHRYRRTHAFRGAAAGSRGTATA